MNIVSVGEILWDIIKGEEFLGGAPFNLCAHLTRLGHSATFVSAVGDDERGARALSQARELGIDTQYLQVTPQAHTGTSEIVLDSSGVASHHLGRPAAYDFMELDSAARAELRQRSPKWICFGTLTQMEARPRQVVDVLIADNPSARRFYDVNLRVNCWTPALVGELLGLATVAKVNDEEASQLSTIFRIGSGTTPRKFAEAIAERFQLEMVCITYGPNGCGIWHHGEFLEQPGYPCTVADTVGAGDAFSAALLHGLEQDWSLSQVADFANRVGSLVASRHGATPLWTEREVWQIGASEPSLR